MKRALAIALALGVAGFSCSRDKDRETKLHRSGDNAAVVLVGATEKAGSLGAEQEPNNETAQAQALTIGSGVTGTLDGSGDVDRFTLSSVSEGMLFVSLEGAADADLKLELQKMDTHSIARSDRGPAGVVEGIAGFWVDAKSEYQLVVSEFTKKRARKTGGRTGVSQAYRLRTSLRTSPEQDFELEPNEDLEGAKEVGAGQEGFGYIGWAGDADWWRVPVSEFSDVEVPSPGEETSAPRRALDFVVSGVAQVKTKLEVATDEGELVATLTSAKGKEVAFRSFVPKVASEFYILKVAAKRSNPETHYRVSVVASELALGGEAEPNDSLELATPISSEIGVLTIASGEASMGDVDMFALAPSQVHRNMNIRLESPRDADLDISVVAESGAVLAESIQKGVGLDESLVAVDVLPNTSPVIVLRAKSVAMPAAYKLSFSLSEGQGVEQKPLAPEDKTEETLE